MTYRASLRQCIEQVAARFAHSHDDMLVILRCERGKYYTACTEDEMLKLIADGNPSQHRIVFYGTARELLAFTDSNQINMFDTPPDDDTDPSATPAGEPN